MNNYQRQMQEMHQQNTSCGSLDDIVVNIEESNDIDKLKRKRKKLKRKIKKLKNKKKMYGLSKKEKHKLEALKDELFASHQEQQMVPKQLFDSVLYENEQMHREKMFMAMMLLEHHPDKDKILRDISTHVIWDELNCSSPKRLPKRTAIKGNNKNQAFFVEGNREGLNECYE